MVFAHFAAGGSEALNLPSWALAYGVFAVSVIMILISRQRDVPRPQPAETTDGDTSPRTRTGAIATAFQVTATAVFWGLVAFCWFGPPTLTQNLAPLALIGVLWSLGGWVALAFGWCWEVLDPFAVFTRRSPRDQPDDSTMPWWGPIPVFSTWVVIWVAWISGDEPRHLGIWLALYGVAMIAIARRGGAAALRAANPLPAALDLTAPVFRPARARRRTRNLEIRRRVGLIAAMLLGAIGANQIAATDRFARSVGSHGEFVVAVVTMAAFALLTAGILGVWRGCERLVERARRESGARPFAAVLGPVAGCVLLAQALPVGLIQAQNLAVLISDPFAQGWDLFGTVYWQVSPQPLSPFTQGIIQVATILAGHLAALAMIGHAATARAADGTTSAVARNRAWTAGLAAMGAIVVSGVVWTLVILG